LVIGHWSLVIGHWSLVIGHWSLVIGHWSLVIGHWSLADILPEFIWVRSGEFVRSIYFPGQRKKHKPPTTKYNQKSQI